MRGAALVVALLALATGFCLFDRHADTDGHVAPLDLCLGMVTVSLSIMPLAGLLAVGWAVSLPVGATYVATRSVPDPPPKPASLL